MAARSEHYVGFVNMLFVIVLALGVQRSVLLFLTPITAEFFMLVTSFVFIALSWVYYHISVDALPYSGSRQTWLRFSLDSIIAFAYTGLIVSISSVPVYGVMLFVIYILYGVHGLLTVYECGWFKGGSLKPSSIPSFWLIFASYFMIPYFVWPGIPPPREWLILLFPAGIILSRYLRHARGAEVSAILSKIWLQPLPVVAIDIDGVLADQVPHVLARAEVEKGVKMKKEDITEWNTMVGDEPFDKLIARYLLDPNFVKTMPTMTRAKEGLERIRSRSKIVLASSRPKETEEETIRWFEERFDCSAPFINTTHSGKGSIAARVLIDDNIDNVASFARGKPNRLAVLLRQPWNKRTEPIADLQVSKKVFVAADWDEVSRQLLS